MKIKYQQHFAAYYHRSTCANILYKHGFGSRQLELKDWQNKTAIEIALNNQAEGSFLYFNF